MTDASKKMFVVSFTPTSGPSKLRSFLGSDPPTVYLPSPSAQFDDTVKSIDNALNDFGDWLRLNAFTWLIFASADPRTISLKVEQSVDPGSRILVVRASPRNLYGEQPKWVWDWIQARVSPLQGLEPEPDFN